ncbi:MAG: ATP-binding cassette domain-containing protein [Dehalococcoidia bacterium]|nr:ATP-binding cassette domain-containing protein [Dehalococcoidia bacterium]
MPTDTLLRIEDLVVAFDGFRVLDDLSLTLARGELRFLIGPNGAGKTTLMDVISGKIRADSGKVMFDLSHPEDAVSRPTQVDIEGEIRFEGHELTRMREDQIVKAGIGRKFQTPSVFGSLTCFNNVEVAAGFRDRVLGFFLPLGRARKEQVMSALERVGLEGRRDVPASALSHGERQWLEIAMLLVQDPKLLLLDEPVAGMTTRERERTGELLHALEGSHSIVVTEHDMDFVRQFSRTVTVLHMGRVLAEGRVEAIQSDPRVQEVYTGRHKTPAGAPA